MNKEELNNFNPLEREAAKKTEEQLQIIQDMPVQIAAKNLMRWANERYKDREIFEIRVKKARGNKENPVTFEFVDFDYKNIDEGC